MQFLFIVMTVISCGVGFAVLSIGSECRRTIVANFRRLNGTLSTNRIRREVAAFRSYVASLAVPLILALPLTVLVVSMVDRRVMPIELVADAFSRFSPDEGSWKESLKDVREDHSRWLAHNGVAEGDGIHQLQRQLWYTWPTIAAAVCCFFMLSVWFFLGMASAAVKEFATGVRFRRTTYAKLDVAQLAKP